MDLAPFIQGGQITGDYKEVKIPLSGFKTANYNLSSVEYLEFGTTPIPQLQFFVDDIEVADNKPPLLKIEPVSNQVIKVLISERFDTTGCYNIKIMLLKVQPILNI